VAYITKVPTKGGEVRWRLRVSLGPDPETGKRKVHTSTHLRKADAEVEGRRLEDLRTMGGLRETSRAPLTNYLKAWLKDVAKPRVRTRTFVEYEATLTRYIFKPPEGAPPLGTVKMHQLSTEAIQKLYTWLSDEKEGRGLSPRTVASLHAVLRSALNHAASTGAIARNPAHYAKPPRQVRKEMKAMTEKEAKAFLEAAAEDRFHGLWVLLVSTGLRPGEGLGLKWTDLEGDRLRVQRSLTRRGVKGWKLTEPKTDRARRTVVLPPVAVKALRGQKKRQAEERLKAGTAWKDHGFMFTTGTGEPMDQINLYRKNFQGTLQAADLGTWKGEEPNRTFEPGFTMYSLRHTAASLALRAGVNVKVVSAMLGHASVTLTLDTYTHLIESQQEDVAERMEKVLGGVG
jgi:integrase